MPTQVVYVFSGVLSRAEKWSFFGTRVARFGNISAHQWTPLTKRTKWTRSHRPACLTEPASPATDTPS